MHTDTEFSSIFCLYRLFIEVTGPTIKCIGSSRQAHKNSLSEESLVGAHKLQVLSPTKSDPGPRNSMYIVVVAHAYLASMLYLL